MRQKAKARELLVVRDMDGVARWARETRDPLATIFALTYDKDELIRWRAVEAAGVVAASVGESDLDRVREFIRRLRWLMNDESGGVGWLAPEVMGEIILKVPVLVEEYAHLLLPLLKEEPFAKGACLALARLAHLVPTLLTENAELLAEHANSTDHELRACALLALGATDLKERFGLGVEHPNDGMRVTLYDFDEGRLVSSSCGEIARDSSIPGTRAPEKSSAASAHGTRRCGRSSENGDNSS